MTNYLMAELSIKKKEAESFAFFISPTPAGKMKEQFKGKIQFEHLIKALNDFDTDKEVKDPKVKIIKNDSNKKQYMEQHFHSKFGYADEKCKEAVRLVTL